MQYSSASWPPNGAIDFRPGQNDEQQQDDGENCVRRDVVSLDGPWPRDTVVQIKKRGGQKRDKETSDDGKYHDDHQGPAEEREWHGNQRHERQRRATWP